MKTLACFAVGTAVASAQLRGLTTDATGSAVWFSTELKLRGAADQSPVSKIFRADASGRVILVAQRQVPDARFAILQSPEVSSDGAVLSYQAAPYCPGFLTCVSDEPSLGVVAAGITGTEFAGRLAMSRNGRFLLRSGYLYDGPSRQVELIDQHGGARKRVAIGSQQDLVGKWHVSSTTGAALVNAGGLWLLRHDGLHQMLAASGMVEAATMDDAGTLIVYQGQNTLFSLSPGDAAPCELVSKPEGVTQPVLSSDGRQLLFLSGGQPWVMEMASGAARKFATVPSGVETATLSGDGRVVWAATYAGQILRVVVESGAITEIVPRTVSLDVPGSLDFGVTLSRGGLTHLTGRGLNGIARVLLDGETLPVLASIPTAITFQTPWDLSGVARRKLEVSGTQSPFEDRLSRPIRAVLNSWPEALRSAAGEPLVVHEDFRGLVTRADRAKPGEILHFYFTGLGPVSPAVPTGQPAPASPLARLAAALPTAWGGSLPTNSPPPEVLYAGLAPGAIGVYQVDVRVPLTAPSQLGFSVFTNDGSALVQFEVAAP